MRELFSEFNKPTKEEFKIMWDEAIFVFDTNVLLSLYRLPQRSRKQLLATLEKLKDRAWIPHQVGLEYYRKRVEIIYEQEKNYLGILQLIEDNDKTVRDQFEKYSRNPFIDCKKILKKLSGVHRAVKTEVEKAKMKHPDWTKEDTVETEINKLFQDKIGLPYPDKEVEEIYKKGSLRYEKEIPPGYKDKIKDSKDKTGLKKFGDLVIWFQIIDKAKEMNLPIVFITDEQKEDWWWKSGEKTIGARHELIKEMKDEAGVSFHMYKTAQFIEYAGEYIKVKVDKELIEDVKCIREEILLDGLDENTGQNFDASGNLGGLGKIEDGTSDSSNLATSEDLNLGNNCNPLIDEQGESSNEENHLDGVNN